MNYNLGGLAGQGEWQVQKDKAAILSALNRL